MSQSVLRAARIVDSIAAEPKTVTQLAAEFGLHRTTMFRELQTLEQVGYARRRKDGTYTLAFHLVRLAHTSLENLDLREAAFDDLRALHKVTGNTIHLAALIEDSIIYVDKVEDSAGVRMYSRVGSPVRPHCSALAKATMSRMGVAQRDAILAGSDWKKYTDKTITSRRDLDVELNQVAAQGWAADDGEFEEFVNCVSVPIVGSGAVVGALSLTALRMVADLEQIKTHLASMQQTASRIARRLG